MAFALLHPLLRLRSWAFPALGRRPLLSIRCVFFRHGNGRCKRLQRKQERMESFTSCRHDCGSVTNNIYCLY